MRHMIASMCKEAVESHIAQTSCLESNNTGLYGGVAVALLLVLEEHVAMK